jgi:prolyl-tRNA editing enzyme YbaK/EbsC (Cys-tRNA(Pro) deacylase)
MLAQVVHYLQDHGTSFRLSSQPTPEPLPAVAHAVPPGGLVVETQVLLVGGRAAIACIARGAKVSLPQLGRELGMVVVEAGPGDLPAPYSSATGPIPPLGGAMDVLTIVDTRAMQASALVFTAFSAFDFLELPIDEFARLERPRVASFATGGELPERC